jgi:glycosyltransferase involved in cell wall biosynthesis
VRSVRESAISTTTQARPTRITPNSASASYWRSHTGRRDPVSERRVSRAPLRVAQVGFDIDVQGREPGALLDAWPTLPAVASACVRAGVSVSVVQAAHRDEVIERNGVTFHFVNEGSQASFRVGGVTLRRRPARLIERVRSLAPDVVHINGLNHPMAARRLMDSMRDVPVLIQDHGTAEPRGWRRVAWRWAYRPLPAVAFTARDQAQPCFASGVFRDGVAVFDIVESSSTFTPGDRDASRRATGMSGDPCMLWTGRLDSNKDPLTALDAFEIAASELPHARLWCCFGSAPLLSDVRRRIARAPLLSERVILVGERPHAEMEARFRAADFYVQCSHREGSGYSLLEALACGATPLVTDIPPWRRIVGTAGSLTPVGDARELGRAMIAWTARDRHELRTAARAHFGRALTFDVIGHELRAAYERLAATP